MDPVLLASCALIGLSVSMLVYLLLARDTVATDGAMMPPPPTGSTLAPRAPTATANVLAKGSDKVATSESSNLHEVLLQRSRSERVVKPWLNKINSLVTGATPKRRVEQLHEMATTAGVARTWTPQRIATARTVSLISGLIMGLLIWRAMASGGNGKLGIAMAVIIAGVGWRGFDVFMTNRARARQEQITMDLPDIADQIAISVQAGLSFEQAIRRTVDSTDGPLSDELGRFLHDTRVGMVRQAAFKNLQERVDVPDVTSFVRAIAQAEKTGVSIAEILQIQADELREKRKQRAEERAMKLPVLMLLPLVTCILPPLLIVLLGPAVIQVTQTGFG